MYFPIRVDLGGLVEEFGLDSNSVEELSNRIVTSVTVEFLNKLQDNVSMTLKGTRATYLNNLEVKDIDSKNKEIILHGWLPNALEDGTQAFDMKPGFAKSLAAHISQNGGWYLSIPFQFATPMALGEGKTKIPQPVYNIVKKQKSPLRADQIPSPYNERRTRPTVSNNYRVFDAYQHKSSIYEGLQKRQQGGYMTFRRVSNNSDPDAFIHRGFKGEKFFEKSLNDISSSVPVLTENTINQFLKDLGV